MCAGESPDEPEGVAGEQVVVRSQGTPGLALGEQSVEECLDVPSAPPRRPLTAKHRDWSTTWHWLRDDLVRSKRGPGAGGSLPQGHG